LLTKKVKKISLFRKISLHSVLRKNAKIKKNGNHANKTKILQNVQNFLNQMQNFCDKVAKIHKKTKF